VTLKNQNNDPKVDTLERLVRQQVNLINSLIKRVSFLERENSRRRSEIVQVGQKK
jgi:hypothetical protein